MIDYLSYSSINLFLTCSEAWKRKYLLKEPQSTTPALVFGSAFHGTIERYIAVKTQLGITEAGNLVDHWPEQWAANQTMYCEWAADTPEQHFNEGIRLLSNPELTQMLNRLTPLADDDGLFMERKIELRVPGVPVPIIGYIDIVTNDGVPGDFKTSKYAWKQEKAKAEIQPLVYLAAMNQLGKPSPGMRFRHYVITKTKEPKVQVLETQHTVDSIFWLFGLVQQVWRAIEAESFVVNPHSWMCKPQFCPAYSKCRGKGL